MSMGVSSVVEKAVAGRWIAGQDILDAIAVARKLNKSNIIAMINYLGEDLVSKKTTDDAVETYLQLINEIKASKVKAQISVKITQLGEPTNFKQAESNYKAIVNAARKAGIFVWLDMEEYNHVDHTIKLYKTQLKKKGVGICIQSYLRRSLDDIKKLVEHKAVIRLVKGAYSEHSKRIAYTTRKSNTENYSVLMQYLFRHGESFMIATHDLNLVEEALTLQRSYRRDVTFAMLNGIRNQYAAQLAKMNKVALYVPFGKQWVAYSYRRLREEGHATTIVKSLFENQKI